MGRPDYQSLSATLPSEGWSSITEIPATDVPALGNEGFILYSPSGTLSRVIASHCLVPSPTGATSGDHEVDIISNGFGAFTMGDSNFGDACEFNAGCWKSATKSQSPPAGSSQAWWMASQNVFDATHGFVVNYFNRTNATELGTQGRYYYFATNQVDLP